MSRWYRAYEGTVTDPKLHEAAVVAGVSRSVAIAAWHAILESCAATRSNRFETTPRRIAVMLGEPVAALDALFSALDELGMISGDTVPAWTRRQFDSDNSTERSRRHREARKETARNADATLQQRSATSPDTDTDTDTESEKSLPSAQQPIAARAALDAMEAALRSAAGLETDPSPGLMNLAPVRGLVDAGYSLDEDVLPALRAVAASGRKGRSWSYYVAAVKQSRADREAAAAMPPPEPSLARAGPRAPPRTFEEMTFEHRKRQSREIEEFLTSRESASGDASRDHLELHPASAGRLLAHGGR